MLGLGHMPQRSTRTTRTTGTTRTAGHSHATSAKICGEKHQTDRAHNANSWHGECPGPGILQQPQRHEKDMPPRGRRDRGRQRRDEGKPSELKWILTARASVTKRYPLINRQNKLKLLYAICAANQISLPLPRLIQCEWFVWFAAAYCAIQFVRIICTYYESCDSNRVSSVCDMQTIRFDSIPFHLRMPCELKRYKCKRQSFRLNSL